MSREVRCGECGAMMVLRESRYGKFWSCTQFPKCKGAHGAHPDGAPLGVPASKMVKVARIKAHAAFDAFWKRNGWSRTHAYRWMQDHLNLSKREAHIGRFDATTCERLICEVRRSSGSSAP